MAAKSQDVVNVALIAAFLLVAFLLDASMVAQRQFISAPFAIPIVIASLRLELRGVVLTVVVSLITAVVSQLFDHTPSMLGIPQLIAIAAIGTVAILLVRQRRLTEERVYEAEVERARTQAILKSAADAIIYVDAETGRTTVNPAGEKLFGRQIVSINRWTDVDRLFSRVGNQPVAAEDLPLSRALSGEVVTQEEWLIVQPGGRQVPVFLSSAPVLDRDGQRIGVVAVMQDISMLKELEQVRREWMSIIAHDLRQPVAIIMGYAGMVSQQLGDTADASTRRPVEHILTAAGNLRKMIEDLMDLSRIETRQLRLAGQVTDLPRLVRDTIERVAPVLQGHPLRVESVDNVPALFVDPLRVEQVLGNLLSNAARYGYPETEIVVEVRYRDEEVTIGVTNYGPGIAPDDLPKLFTRFYRTPGARRGKVKGLGLGLYICSGIVEAHGGRIWAESSQGATTFYIALPVEAVARPSVTGSAKEAVRDRPRTLGNNSAGALGAQSSMPADEGVN